MKIIKEPALRTWNLGVLPGTPQTEEAQGALDDMLIKRPDEKAGKTGESFNTFSHRVLAFVRERVVNAPDKSVILTHNSVFGLIKLWDRKGRPSHLNQPFRTEYTKQGSDTGDHYTIEGKNGTIYVCRHGETIDNKEGNFRSDDADLTAKGKQEAKDLGKELGKVQLSEIFTSPLPRTLETADEIAKAQKPEEVSEEVKEGVKDNEKEEATEEMESGESEESKGLCRSVFLYMEPTSEDSKETFASCAGCRMFLSTIERCSIHGKGVKVDADDSCGLFIRGKAPKDEVDHMEASVTKEESGFTEGPVQCKNCHYYDKSDGDCLLFRLVGIKEYKVKPEACCNAFSAKHEVKEDSKEDKDK